MKAISCEEHKDYKKESIDSIAQNEFAIDITMWGV